MQVPVQKTISIHVPREGHDNKHFTITIGANVFQSTCPARGTTKRISLFSANSAISIHVPREGHDRKNDAKKLLPHGFQSTCPARGTT